MYSNTASNEAFCQEENDRQKNLNFSDKTKLPYEYPKLEIILDSLNTNGDDGRYFC
jgi:hypothetical protein